jgi:hypothetical protein
MSLDKVLLEVERLDLARGDDRLDRLDALAMCLIPCRESLEPAWK